ncbi:hypothetical protein ANN_17333 [Periplaneta americana]|uniref:Uncharacterized protein n=1 Tax=Periplaneta americana TaxID=6978 RepID=A0ABQ8ST83_PERAM|nr:hypothetical protein ANN_17333 [Periplaneta americana]
MIYDTWYPFEISKSPMYEIILMTQKDICWFTINSLIISHFLIIMFQFLTTARFVVIFFGSPYIYTILICVACSQLQKVRFLLLEIKWKCLETLEKSVDGKHINEDQAHQIQDKLNGIVRLHQQVIRYV